MRRFYLGALTVAISVVMATPLSALAGSVVDADDPVAGSISGGLASTISPMIGLA
jgi:hypothetical protein